MSQPGEEANAESDDRRPERVFRAEWPRYDRPGKIVTFGPYLPVAPLLDTTGAIRYADTARESGEGYSVSASEVAEMRRAVSWTRWINALNRGRKWPVARLAARFDNLVEPGIAVAVVPSHDPFLTDTAIRSLGREIAARNGRVDATGVLVRHTKIKRISYGGPSFRTLHRRTIEVVGPERVVGLPVLLLDDIARSGASLRACEELLYDAGAAHVQAVALGRVTG